jgi:hypothetical protein
MEAGFATWLMPDHGETVAPAESHVLQREFVGRRRHFAALHHGLTGMQAQILHGEAVWANLLAKTAKATRIYQSIGLAFTHNDGEVVVDFPGILFWISAESLHIDTNFDALHAFALQAALRFRLCFG